MRSLLVISLMLVLGACTRMSADFHLDNAYRQYAAGDCAAVALELSQAQRQIRSRRHSTTSACSSHRDPAGP